MKNVALMVIDIQNDITKNYKEIILNINKSVRWAKENDFCVIYIKHNNITDGTRTFKPGTKGSELVGEMEVVSDNIFVKTKSNALTCEELTKFIDENGIKEFFVVGADATACVKSTCFNMKKQGYIVHVLADCITSYDKTKIPEMIDYYKGKGCLIENINDK